MTSRPTNVQTLALTAECCSCDWTSDARNSQGNAARHHDATGHVVIVERTTSITYGTHPTPEELGQTSLDTEGSIEP
jgi:hypothetical protein